MFLGVGGFPGADLRFRVRTPVDLCECLSVSRRHWSSFISVGVVEYFKTMCDKDYSCEEHMESGDEAQASGLPVGIRADPKMVDQKKI